MSEQVRRAPLAPEQLDADRRLRLPPPLAALLRTAKHAEELAVGQRRRSAFLLTRRVIGGLVEAGYPLQVIAVELGVRAESVRSRTQAGPVALADVSALTGIALEQLEQRAEGLAIAVEEGQLHSSHLRALLLTPPLRAAAPEDRLEELPEVAS